jgi:hypothetical protein
MSDPADALPISCSLDAGSLAQRVGEWRDLVTSAVDSVETSSTSLRLTLRDSDEALVVAASLGQREKRCCGFFDLSIELGPDRRVLVLRVPVGAEEVLVEFVAAIAPAPR